MKLENKLMIGFLAAAVLLLAVGLAGWRSTAELRGKADWDLHTQTVLKQLASLRSATALALVAQRGFIITGDESFLEPYAEAERQARTVLATLRQLTDDNPTQQRRLDELEPLIGQRLLRAREVIERRRTAGFEAAQAEMSTIQRRQLSDAIDRLVGELEKEEAILQTQRAEETRVATQRALGIIAGGTLFSLLVVGAALVVSHRDLAARRRMEENLRASEARSRALADNLPQMVFQKGRDFRWQWLGPLKLAHCE